MSVVFITDFFIIINLFKPLPIESKCMIIYILVYPLQRSAIFILFFVYSFYSRVLNTIVLQYNIIKGTIDLITTRRLFVII